VSDGYRVFEKRRKHPAVNLFSESAEKAIGLLYRLRAFNEKTASKKKRKKSKKGARA
jgi:hypothetical protein